MYNFNKVKNKSLEWKVDNYMTKSMEMPIFLFKELTNIFLCFFVKLLTLVATCINDRTHSSTACNQEIGPGTFICHQPVLIHIIHGRIHHGMPQKLLKTDKFVGILNTCYYYYTRLKLYINTCINF